MLRLAFLGEEVVFFHHFPKMDDDLHASSEELAEATVLHLGRPDDPGRPVLDVPGGEKKFIVKIDGTYVVVVVVLVVVVVVARGARSPLSSSEDASLSAESTMFVAAAEVAEEAAAEEAEITIFGCVVGCVWLCVVWRKHAMYSSCLYLPC